MRSINAHADANHYIRLIFDRRLCLLTNDPCLPKEPQQGNGKTPAAAPVRKNKLTEIIHGIDRSAIHTDFKMTVRAGRAPGTSHISNDLATLNRLAHTDNIAAHMRVQRGVVLAILFAKNNQPLQPQQQ